MSPARPLGPARLATYFHVHLVSDSTGETLNAMAKAVTARFDGVIPIEHIYSLVRSAKQMERVLQEVESAPGVVLHTLVDRDLREQLEEGCRRLDMPQIGALDPLVGAMSRYLGAALSTRVGAQHALDHDYFNRIAALDFAMAYDDGHPTRDRHFAQTRPLPRLEPDVLAQGARDQQDVGEDDRRIEAEPAHGLKRRLGGHVGVQTEGDEVGRLGPQLAILRQIPTGLAHEPHRRTLQRLPAESPEHQGCRIGILGLIGHAGGLRSQPPALNP